MTPLWQNVSPPKTPNIEDAHAKLVALADAYKEQTSRGDRLEAKLADEGKASTERFKTAMNRCLKSESREEQLAIEHERLRKKLAKLKELYNGETEKCNKAAAVYRKNSKMY